MWAVISIQYSFSSLGFPPTYSSASSTVTLSIFIFFFQHIQRSLWSFPHPTLAVSLMCSLSFPKQTLPSLLPVSRSVSLSSSPLSYTPHCFQKVLIYANATAYDLHHICSYQIFILKLNHVRLGINVSSRVECDRSELCIPFAFLMEASVSNCFPQQSRAVRWVQCFSVHLSVYICLSSLRHPVNISLYFGY